MPDVSGLRQRLIEGARNLGEAASELVMEQLDVAVPEQTGDLKRSIDKQFTGGDDNPGWLFTARAPQAEWTEFGTKPHEIFPTQPGGVLRFEMAGTIVFSKHVNHPGNEAKPWFFPTVSQENWRAALDESLGAAGWS